MEFIVIIKQGKSTFIEKFPTFSEAASYFLRREDFVWDILIYEDFLEKPPTPEDTHEPIEIGMLDTEGRIYFRTEFFPNKSVPIK